MKCKWYADFEGTCTNDSCPYRGDVCRVTEHQEVCRYAENMPNQKIPTLNIKELEKALRSCMSTDDEHCDNCPLLSFGNVIECETAIKKQAADMLEKLSKDVVPMDFHERCMEIEIQKRMEIESKWISVKDELPKKNQIVFITDVDGNLAIATYRGDEEWVTHAYTYASHVTFWLKVDIPEPPKEDDKEYRK